MKNKLVNSMVASVITLFLGLSAYLGQKNPEGELPLIIIVAAFVMLGVSGLASFFYEQGIEDTKLS